MPFPNGKELFTKISKAPSLENLHPGIKNPFSKSKGGGN
jgi:hypothetical protein